MRLITTIFFGLTLILVPHSAVNAQPKSAPAQAEEAEPVTPPIRATIRCNRDAEAYVQELNLIPEPFYGAGYERTPGTVGVLVGRFQSGVNVYVNLIARRIGDAVHLYFFARHFEGPGSSGRFSVTDTALGGPSVMALQRGQSIQSYGDAGDGVPGAIGCQVRMY